MKTAMQLTRKNETPVLKCDCGKIFCIDSNDSIIQMGIKERKFRMDHANCTQKRKYEYHQRKKI